MASCTHEEVYSQTPPTAEFITQNFPYITPNKKLDRNVDRCKLCDLIQAQERAFVAENPPPGINVIDRIEHDIDNLEDSIKAGVATKQDKEDLKELKLELENAIALMNFRIQEAWTSYWEIWGPGDGPDTHLDSLFDDGEDVIDWRD